MTTRCATTYTAPTLAAQAAPRFPPHTRGYALLLCPIEVYLNWTEVTPS